MQANGGVGRVPPPPLRSLLSSLPRPRTPSVVLVQFHTDLTHHEELLNTMLQQALATVLEAENGLSMALQDLFLASLNLDVSIQGTRRSTSPKTSSTFLNTLQDHWWSQLPSSTQTCNIDCPICLSDFDASDVVVNLPCHHTFHSSCILPWLQDHNLCPTCRYALPSDDAVAEPKQSTRVEEAIQTDPIEFIRPAELVDIPGTMPTEIHEAILESEASAFVEDSDLDTMEDVVEEILDEMMEIEANSVVQQVQNQRQRMLTIERMLDEAIASDTVE